MGASSLLGAGISGISSLFGASEKSDAAQQAAALQEAAAQQAQGLYSNAQAGNTNALSPYTGPGSNAASLLNDNLSTLASYTNAPTAQYVDPSAYDTSAAPYRTSGTANNISGTADNISATPYNTTTNLDQGQLEQTPGYQFTEAQGLKGVQNSAAARGLGVSGAALKGAATYATGLANNTYQQQYQDELTSNAQNFSNANTAANTNFGQQATAATTNYTQQAGANEQNFSNVLNANKQNVSNALSATAQNYGMDQTGFTDAQANQTNSYNKLAGAAGMGQQAATTLANSNNYNTAGSANALMGGANAGAAADNTAGSAYASAISGLGSAGTNALNQYNNYGVSSAGTTTTTNADGSKSTVPNYGSANTFGNLLKGFMS